MSDAQRETRKPTFFWIEISTDHFQLSKVARATTFILPMIEKYSMQLGEPLYRAWGTVRIESSRQCMNRCVPGNRTLQQHFSACDVVEELCKELVAGTEGELSSVYLTGSGMSKPLLLELAILTFPRL